MIDHNVMRFDVSVHDSLAVAVVKSLEEFEDVVSHIDVVEFGVQASEVGVVHVLKDQGRGLALLDGIFRLVHTARHLVLAMYAMEKSDDGTATYLVVSHNIEEGHDVWAT